MIPWKWAVYFTLKSLDTCHQDHMEWKSFSALGQKQTQKPTGKWGNPLIYCFPSYFVFVKWVSQQKGKWRPARHRSGRQIVSLKADYDYQWTQGLYALVRLWLKHSKPEKKTNINSALNSIPPALVTLSSNLFSEGEQSPKSYVLARSQVKYI